MNVFILHHKPRIAAQMHCDKHVVKMIIESAQMLSTAHRMLDGKPERRPSKSGKTMQQYYKLPDKREKILYKAVHKYHPCTQWTMEHHDNYDWHYELFYQLCREYTYRYGKKHKTANLLDELYHKPHNINRDFVSHKKHKWANDHFDTYYKWGRLTTPPLAMKSNPECMFPDDPVKSYRKFYKTKQARFKMAWTNRPVPEWF